VLPSAPKKSTLDKRGLRVLVVDDSQLDQLVAVRLLERCGHRANVVNNGAEALTALGDRLFDIVLMDVEMPEVDGMTAMRSIRQNERPGVRVPIVAVSASEGERRCLDSGADAFLSKPITLERLQAAIRSAVLRN
jgi:CheY-like chemotaxis protein